MSGVSTYEPDKGAYICEQLALGRSLKAIITKDPDMPAMSTVFKWLLDHSTFSEMYARAREAQADALFDETLDIADESKEDYVKRKHFEGADEGWEVNGEAIQRARLRIDTRKWIAGKLRPKKYGERMIMAGDEEMPLEMNITIGGQKP